MMAKTENSSSVGVDASPMRATSRISTLKYLTPTRRR